MLKQFLTVSNDNKLEIHHNLVFLNCVDHDNVNRQPQRVSVSGISPPSEQMTKGWCSNDKLYKIFTVANLNLYINLVDKINSKVSCNTSTNTAPQFLQQLAPLTICDTSAPPKKIYLLFDHS